MNPTDKPIGLDKDQIERILDVALRNHDWNWKHVKSFIGLIGFTLMIVALCLDLRETARQSDEIKILRAQLYQATNHLSKTNP